MMYPRYSGKTTKGCHVCDGIDPKTCLCCKGKTRLCDWVSTPMGMTYNKKPTREQENFAIEQWNKASSEIKKAAKELLPFKFAEGPILQLKIDAVTEGITGDEFNIIVLLINYLPESYFEIKERE